MKTHRLAFPLLFLLVACAETETDDDPNVSTAEAYEICLTCDDGGPSGPDYCQDVCSTDVDCNTPCVDRVTGAERTCGATRQCQRCTDTCSAEASCASSCVTSANTISTCEKVGQCHKYDVYCAYPALNDYTITDAHEDGAGGRWAYMFYASSPGSKYGTFAAKLGTVLYDQGSAWASNFQGPTKIYGESARTQWEWAGNNSNLWRNFGRSPVPFHEGRRCIAVDAGRPRPNLGRHRETVMEDDECVGTGPFAICNPDDYVGSFEIDRNRCNAVWNTGAASGWAGRTAATLAGSISTLNYDVFCYSCKGNGSVFCNKDVAGVEPRVEYLP